MNKLVLGSLVLFCVFSSCSTFQRITNSDHMSSDERTAEVTRQREDLIASENAREKAVRIGTPIEMFKMAFGSPVRTQEDETNLTLQYIYNDEPYAFTFRDGKLVKYALDTDQQKLDAADDRASRPVTTDCSPGWFGKMNCTTRRN